jgi:D-3-phosphoglycerate dehydrogenase
MVVRAGAGYDTIDVAHCASKGIYVTNCPGKNAHAVAELTLGLILCIDRRIPENDHLLKEGKWNKGAYANCQGIKGKTIGLVGLGSIGQLVAERALAFEMNVIAFVRTPKPELAKRLGIKLTDNLLDVLAESDIVSLHVPGGKGTENLVDAKFLETMRPDAMLINTSRASVVNEDALLQHMIANPNFWYGTDVYKGEPSGKDGAFDHPLAKHPHSVGTHHIGASTKQAESAIGDEAVRIIKKFNSTGLVDDANCVNREQNTGGLHKMSVRHLDRVGVLAHVFTVFAQHEFNVQELENIVFKDR